MNSFLSEVTPVTNPVAAAVLNSLWEGAALTAVVWVCLRIFRRLNATTRYVIWCSLLISVSGLTGLGVVGGLIPKRAAQVGPRQEPAGNPDAAFHAQVEAERAALQTVEGSAAPPRPSEEPRQAGISDRSFQLPPFRMLKVNGTWSVWIVGLWVVATLSLVSRLVSSYLHLRKLKRTSKPLDEMRQQRFEMLLETARITRPIRAGTSGGVTIPLALGLSDPVILIPERLPGQLEAHELDQVFLHEAAHLWRRDDWTNLLQRILETLFFINPAVLWIGRRLSLEREIACDDCVTGITGQAKPYALCLTKLAEVTYLGSHQALASGAWISKTQLTKRIVMLLDCAHDRTNRISIAACAVALLGLGGLLFVLFQAGPVVAADNPPPPATSGTTAVTPGAGGTAAAYALPPYAGQGYAVEGDENDPIAKRDREIQQLKQELENARRLDQIRRGDGSGSAAEAARFQFNPEMMARYGLLPHTIPDVVTEQTAEARQRESALKEKIFASLLATAKNDSNMRLRGAAVGALVRMEPSKAIDPLVEIALKDKDLKIRELAVGALVGIPDVARSETLFNLYDQLEDVESKAIVVRKMGENIPNISRELTEKWIAKLEQIAKESSSGDLRILAIELLGAVGQNLATSAQTPATDRPVK